MQTVHFDLSRPLKYSHNNTEAECEFIELREPTGKVAHICGEIEAEIQSGILKMSKSLGDDVIKQATEEAKEKRESKDDEDAQKMEPGAVVSMMTGGGADMKKIVLNFRELFKQVAWMGGEKAITVPRMDEMTYSDFRRMMGVYAANFILNLQ